MRAGRLTTCDFDGEVLYGKKGTAWVQKEHLSFKGRMELQLPDLGDFCYVSDSPDAEHHFCNIGCLADFIEVKKKRFLEHRHRANLANLRREAERV